MGAMNRREWLKSGGTLMAGGLSLATTGFIPGTKSIKKIKKDIRSTRRFVSDHDFMRLFPQSDTPAIRLMANENPFGPSPKAKEAIANAIDSGYQYPFRMFDSLISKIAKHEQVEDNQILITAGSSDILTGAAIYFTKLEGNIISGDPSYSDMPSLAEDLGCEVRWVPLTDDYTLDLKAIEARIDENTKLVYLCNPNNPTATILDTQELTAFTKRVSKKVPVFIDEAYIEYLDDPDAASMTHLVKEGYNVIVARTFSKLYGFAGIRAGYAIAGEEMVNNLVMHCRGHMSLSGMSLAAAIAAYREMEFLNDAKAKTMASKEYLYSILEGEGYEYIPSSTNFVMFPINMPGKRFSQEMFKRGVAVRNWEFNNQHWCRVSIGTMPQMEAFAAAFTQIS